MGVTVVFQWELVDGQTHQQAIQELHGRINNTGAVQEGKFYYESKFYQASDSATTRDFYTLKTSEYPVTVFARVDDSTKDKNSCIQCDSPMESLLVKLREFFTPKRTFEIRGTRFKLADFWIRPGIVTSSGSNKCVTIEIEYTPSYFADDCWPLFSELGSYILNRQIDHKPPTLMENNKQFNPGMMVQQYVEIFSRKATTQANFQQPMKQEQIQAYNTQM